MCQHSRWRQSVDLPIKWYCTLVCSWKVDARKLARKNCENRILDEVTPVAKRECDSDKLDEACMIEWCLCDTAVATSSWASVDLDRDRFLERTESGNGFGRDSRRGGKSGRQKNACTMLAQDSRSVRNSFHGKEASAPLHRRACTSPYAFLQRAYMHIWQVLWAPACADVYVRQVLQMCTLT